MALDQMFVRSVEVNIIKRQATQPTPKYVSTSHHSESSVSIGYHLELSKFHVVQDILQMNDIDVKRA